MQCLPGSFEPLPGLIVSLPSGDAEWKAHDNSPWVFFIVIETIYAARAQLDQRDNNLNMK